MKIRLAADLQQDSIVDGEGIRTVIWTQGCPHNCKGCHNPDTHDFNDGALIDIEEIKTDVEEVEPEKKEKIEEIKAVSYTHLTLPTIA